MENYNLLYLEQAKSDLIEIASYISDELKNSQAAEHLIGKIIDTAENIKTFPYSNPVYVPIKPLKHEYRKAVIENFMLFYWVNEKERIITVSRIIYARRNLKQQIKD